MRIILARGRPAAHVRRIGQLAFLLRARAEEKATPAGALLITQSGALIAPLIGSARIYATSLSMVCWLLSSHVEGPAAPMEP
jgi:hypothetical protein